MTTRAELKRFVERVVVEGWRRTSYLSSQFFTAIPMFWLYASVGFPPFIAIPGSS